MAPEQEDIQPRLAINAPAGVTFDINDAKLYISIVTFSTEDYNKLLQHLNTRFKRTVRYGSEISNQPKNNNLNYLIDPTFSKVKRFVII